MVSRDAYSYSGCMQNRNESSCGGECTWYDTTNTNGSSGPKVPLNKTRLFTKEFCHPNPAVMNLTNYTSWYECPTDASESECGMNCLYTNGAELIPENDFCAPQNISTDVNAIVACARADDQFTHSDMWMNGAFQCAWRKGKTVLNNTQVVQGSFLFESNFCHPPTTDRWEVLAPRCLNKTDEYSCRDSQCVWSTGQELTPYHSFCGRTFISNNATAY
jgi:hypothetical protein